MKELKMFIDGRFIENESGKWIKVLNPYRRGYFTDARRDG